MRENMTAKTNANLNMTAQADTSLKNTAPAVKVVKDRVIELTYDSFDFDAAAAYLNKYDIKMGGCSAIKCTIDNKVYVGRDYDFYCSDSPAFIVRNNAGAIPTIGIGNSPSSLDAWSEDFKLRPEVSKALPYLCCDVMSKAGLYCETNIRPYEKGLSCSSTNPGKERRCTQTFMQTMLSQYATIDEVLQHLDDYDWFDLASMGFEQSFLLTDANGRSVIIEFAADAYRWQEASYNANFFINNEWYEKETIGCGELRLVREFSYLPFVRKEEDVYTMMKRGAYDQFYHEGVDLDLAIPEFYEMIGFDKNSAKENPDAARAAAAKEVARLSKYTWQDRIDTHSWESVFITTADVTDRKLHVHFSEHYNIDFDVEF